MSMHVDRLHAPATHHDLASFGLAGRLSVIGGTVWNSERQPQKASDPVAIIDVSQEQLLRELCYRFPATNTNNTRTIFPERLAQA
jgi:hypothetical protein